MKTSGLLRLPFFIASLFYIIGLAGFYIFFVATKKYATQGASLTSGSVSADDPKVLEGAGEELFPMGV